jgi:hypothetical protein
MVPIVHFRIRKNQSLNEYSKPNEYSPHVLTYYCKIHFNINLKLYARVFREITSFTIFSQNFEDISYLSHACYLPNQLVPFDFIILMIQENKWCSSSLSKHTQPLFFP